MPTTVETKHFVGIDLTNCRCLEERLNISGTASLDNGIFEQRPCSNGCDVIKLIYKSVSAPTRILGLCTLSSSKSCQGSINASGISIFTGTYTNRRLCFSPPTDPAILARFYILMCIFVSVGLTRREE